MFKQRLRPIKPFYGIFVNRIQKTPSFIMALQTQVLSMSMCQPTLINALIYCVTRGYKMQRVKKAGEVISLLTKGCKGVKTMKESAVVGVIPLDSVLFRSSGYHNRCASIAS